MYNTVRKDDEDSKLKHDFLILYQGLKTKHFYWEFVNSLKKIIILISFLLPDAYKILLSASTLLFTWRLQSYLQPYKHTHNNDIEMFGVNVAIVTLLCGMIFNQPDTSDSLNTVLLIIMLVLNVIFIIQWIYLFITNLGEKYTLFAEVT